VSPESSAIRRRPLSRDGPARPSCCSSSGRQTDPLSRSDRASLAGPWPVTWQPPWSILRIELADGVVLLTYQELEESWRS
jgi:hypothetical protein